MKYPCLVIFFVPSGAFTPSKTRKNITGLHNSVSGGEKRTYRQSIAPLSPNTGATGSAGPISNSYRRTSSPPRRLQDTFSSPTHRTLTNQGSASPPVEQSDYEEITRLKRTLKQRDDDVETLIYEIYRLQELSSKVRDANDARSNDFTLLKKEAESLKQDFERRTEQNKEKMLELIKRLQDKEKRIFDLERQAENDAKTIAELQSQLSGVSSPSIGLTPNRVPSREYRATKSVIQDKSVAVVGGAPILYRSFSSPPKQSLSDTVGNLIEDPNVKDKYTPIDEGMNPDHETIIGENVSSTMSGADDNVEDYMDGSHPAVLHRYPKPRGIGVGDRGMLEEENDDRNV